MLILIASPAPLSELAEPSFPNLVGKPHQIPTEYAANLIVGPPAYEQRLDEIFDVLGANHRRHRRNLFQAWKPFRIFPHKLGQLARVEHVIEPKSDMLGSDEAAHIVGVFRQPRSCNLLGS